MRPGILFFCAALLHGATMAKGAARDHTDVPITERAVDVTLADGERIKVAVADALEKRPESDFRDEGRRLRKAEPRLDPSGTLRIGAWFVDKRGGETVLTCARTSGQVMYVMVAFLRREGDGAWTVTRIDSERYHG
jgi:hypothetical protein